MGLGDLVVEKFGLVVLDLNAYLANLNLVLNNVSVDVETSDDGGAAAEADLVALNLRHRSDALDKDTGSLTAHDNVFGNDNVIFWFAVNHYSSSVEMGETALIDGRVTLEAEDACSEAVLECVSLEVAVEHLDAAVGVGDDAGHLSMRLTGATVE